MKHVHMWVVSLMVLALAHADAQESPEQPRYWLERGEGYPVCQDFLANLNAFPADEPPLMCEQKIHATHPEFTRPTWVEMDIETNLRLIHQAESLLTIFTPIGTEPKSFEEWVPLFRERLRSGQANPRLRRAPFMLRQGEPETFIWYEPVRDTCLRDLERTGLAGGAGGHVFVLRTATSKLEAFNGLVGTLGRTDVLMYHGVYPYLTNANPGFAVIEGVQKPVNSIGLHAVIPSRIPGDDRYFGGPRCYALADREPSN